MQKQVKPLQVKLDRKSYPSVFFVNETSIFPDNYPAKWNRELVRFLIEMFTDPEELVLDPMCGSGVAVREAVSINRQGLGSDINQEALKLCVQHDRIGEYRQLDARNLIFPENSIDLLLTSPSFGISIDAKHAKYSDHMSDIANCKTFEQWRQNFKDCLPEFYRITKPGRLCIIETRPRRKDWESKPLFNWIINDAEQCGFSYFDMIIEIQAPYSKFPVDDPEPIDHRHSYPQHSFLLMFQKPIQDRL